jgi:hypothetical protein
MNLILTNHLHPSLRAAKRRSNLLPDEGIASTGEHRLAMTVKAFGY